MKLTGCQWQVYIESPAPGCTAARKCTGNDGTQDGTCTPSQPYARVINCLFAERGKYGDVGQCAVSQSEQPSRVCDRRSLPNIHARATYSCNHASDN